MSKVKRQRRRRSLLRWLFKFEQQKASLAELHVDFTELRRRAIAKGKVERATWLKMNMENTRELLEQSEQLIHGIEADLAAC